MQNYELKSRRIREAFDAARKSDPGRFREKLTLSWSVWMFGIERLEDSVKRLKQNSIDYIELTGDRQTADSGIPLSEVKQVLGDNGMKVSGVCGMFSPDNDLSSPDVYSIQNAVDYIKREVEFLAEVGGEYLIVVPSAVGRPDAVDGNEFIRSVSALRKCAPFFAAHGIKAAIEPIRSAEVSLVHSIDDALNYIEAVGEPSIGHINADTYHMLLEEGHIGEAMLRAGERLTNLHIADSNRDAPGTGMIDFDTVIRAAYLVGMNEAGRYVTPEPLGPYPVPYVLANSPCDVAVMDKLAADTVRYFREREAQVLEQG